MPEHLETSSIDLLSSAKATHAFSRERRMMEKVLYGGIQLLDGLNRS